MTSVFLSYDRADAAKARSIAAALEKAGHSVWWDRHIKGGSQYSKEIEQALAAADAVVVLWSRNSIDSAWVRDEAASGRDRGRLVPVRLDNTDPPLGFRQYQTIDLANGRMGRAAREALLGALAGVADGEPQGVAAPAQPRRSAPSLPIAWIMAGLVLAAIVGALTWRPWAASDELILAVGPAASDEASRALARDLATDLASLQTTSSGEIRIIDASNGTETAALLLEAAARPGAPASASLVLKSAQDSSILWSKEFGREAGTPADTKQQMSYTAGRVIGCAVDGLDPGGTTLPADTLRLYLTGCSQFAEGNDETVSSAVPVFEQVVKDAPQFKAAWAKLLLAQNDAVAGGRDSAEARATLRNNIAQARRLDPEMPEATLAEVTLLPRRAYGDQLRLLDEARERHPENAIVRGYRALALMQVGRTSEAVEDAREAARLDPTSPQAHSAYVLTLAHSGRVEAARAEMQRAERQWAGTGRLEELRHAFNLRYGDPKAMVKTDTFKQANPRMQMYFLTRADPTPANVNRFMAFLQDLYARRGLTPEDIVGHAQAYGEFDREDDLYRLIDRLPAGADLSPLAGVMFRPSLREFQADPRFMSVAQRIGLVDYWMKSGKWPDFCFDPDQPYDCKAEAARLAAGRA